MSSIAATELLPELAEAIAVAGAMGTPAPDLLLASCRSSLDFLAGEPDAPADRRRKIALRLARDAMLLAAGEEDEVEECPILCDECGAEIPPGEGMFAGSAVNALGSRGSWHCAECATLYGT